MRPFYPGWVGLRPSPSITPGFPEPTSSEQNSGIKFLGKKSTWS